MKEGAVQRSSISPHSLCCSAQRSCARAVSILCYLIINVMKLQARRVGVFRMTATQNSDPSERLTLTIPRSLKRRVEAAIPDRQRSAFAAEALEEALKARARREALKMLEDLPVSKTGGEDSLDVQRQYRANFDKT